MDNMKEFFLRSLDSDLTSDEKKTLDDAFANSVELQKYRDEILEMRNSLRELKTSAVQEGFTDNVMKKVHNKARVESAMVYSMEQIFKKISYVAAAVLLFMFAYNIYNSDDLNVNTLIGLHEISIEQEFEDAIASID